MREIEADESAAFAALTSPDPALRLVAIYVSITQWRSEGAVRVCETLLISDDDIRVRDEAVFQISGWYAGTSDARIGKLLASIVRSEAEPDGLRLNAFRGLIDVCGLVHAWPKLLILLQFPEDIDWAFVARFE